MLTIFDKPLDEDIANLQDGLAIIANGDTHASISSGQFVYVRNHATLPDGLYKATSTIGTNVALTTSNLADMSGALNDVQAQITTINNNVGTVPSGQTVEGQITALNSNFGNLFTRKYRTYTNITIPSSGYITVDSYSEMNVDTSLYLISMMVRGWTGSINGVTLGKGTNGLQFYLIGEPNTTISSITVEYIFSGY